MSGEKRVSRTLLFVALLVVGVVTVPAAAFHGSTLPTLSSDPLAGAGAVSYRFTVPQGASVEIEIEATYDQASLVGDGFWLYDGAGQSLFSFMSTTWIGGGPEVHIELPDPFGVVQDIRPEPGSFGSGTLVGLELDAGEYVALVGSIADGTLVEGTVSLFAEAGSVLNNKVLSAGGFAHRETDFRGTNVVVGAPVGLPIFVPSPIFIDPSLRPVVMAGASLGETVTRSMYGWFGGFNLVQETTVEGPGGTSTGQNHFFENSPAGSYTFTVDLTAAAPGGRIWVWGLDASLA